MSTDPDRIRQEIETTRGELSSDVDALTDKVNPRRVATERMNRARSRYTRIREKVMGTPTHLGEPGGPDGGRRLSDTAHRATGAVAGAAHQATDAASSAADRARAVPRMSRERTEGNPLAAGLIAFGVGLLASSLIPPSQREQQLAARAKQQAMEHSGEIKQQAGAMAHQAQSNLRKPAQQAARSVMSKAAESASAVGHEGKAAAQQIQGQARESRDNLRR